MIPTKERKVYEKAEEDLKNPESLEQCQLKAVSTIVMVGRALEKGIKHYDNQGKELTSIREIVEVLHGDGVIYFKDPNAIPPAIMGCG